MATVINRLTKIDNRLATRVSRNKIGSLIGRVYFTPNATSVQAEVDIFEFVDQGITTVPWATGTEQVGHRYVAHIDRDWWDLNGAIDGKYQIKTRETGPFIPVTAENQTVEDDKTYVVMIFRVITEVEPELDISLVVLD